jgi:hypothetical protein
MMPEAEGKNCADVAFLLLAIPPDSSSLKNLLSSLSANTNYKHKLLSFFICNGSLGKKLQRLRNFIYHIQTGAFHKLQTGP